MRNTYHFDTPIPNGVLRPCINIHRLFPYSVVNRSDLDQSFVVREKKGRSLYKRDKKGDYASFVYKIR